VSADANEAAVYDAIVSLSEIPPSSLRYLHENGTLKAIHIGSESVPQMDDLQVLQGVPTGWGSDTWDAAAGLYSPYNSVIAYNTEAATASDTPLLHEIGHAFDALYASSTAPDFAVIFNDLKASGTLNPYLANDRRELFAEVFATYFSPSSVDDPAYAVELRFGQQMADWARVQFAGL
jgi:hypothetical protein